MQGVDRANAANPGTLALDRPSYVGPHSEHIRYTSGTFQGHIRNIREIRKSAMDKDLHDWICTLSTIRNFQVPSGHISRPRSTGLSR